MNAFDEPELTRLIQLDLGVGGAAFADLTSNLVAWAEREGRLAELLRAAARERPRSPLVRLEYTTRRRDAFGREQSRRLKAFAYAAAVKPSIVIMTGPSFDFSSLCCERRRSCGPRAASQDGLWNAQSAPTRG